MLAGENTCPQDTMEIASSCQLQHLRPQTSMHQFSSVLVSLQNLPSHIAMKLPISSFEVLRIIMVKVNHFQELVSTRLGSLSKCTADLFRRSYLLLLFQSNPLIVQIIYFMLLPLAGFLALKNLKPLNKPTTRNLDLMFTSVSTVTVSSMATVEMEDFSGQQLWILIILMLFGGDMFTKMLGLHLKNARGNTGDTLPKRSSFISRDIETCDVFNNNSQNNMEAIQSEATIPHNKVQESKGLNLNSCNILAHVVTGYFIAAIVCGSVVITIYLLIDSDARQLLKSKDIKICTFSVFTAVSSFANCGFTPVNDNMAIFRNNPTLLLLVTPQILIGNTLFPPLLRLSIWALGKVSRREEYAYILQHPKEIGYRHLRPYKNSVHLVLTGVLIILLQAIFLCYFEWDSKALEGMKWFQKLVGSLFQSANSRHAGETVINISTLSPPILVIFAVVIAYGNVGYSLGYSCDKLLKPDPRCKDFSYGFVGRWTDKGKVIIIVVMFLGRFKTFTLNGRKP